ncbi:carbonic anhydrase [Frankia sp. CcI49]|uniref:SulP family inorganic anion transporter n=1 Tax=unclassified Frankia TaxID=2632575 RepID=UPI0007C740D5|nr:MULTISPECIES: SulP family inorganic anion transporter [unclassified Frankia]ONH61064.1 carbonic anhydrase [Frankia sp. CcI49]
MHAEHHEPRNKPPAGSVPTALPYPSETDSHAGAESAPRPRTSSGRSDQPHRGGRPTDAGVSEHPSFPGIGDDLGFSSTSSASSTSAAASSAPTGTASAAGRLNRGGPLDGAPRGVWRHDLEASVVVFLVALPLSLGIAVASGAPVVAGIIAAVVGGVVAGALGGVPLQVSGPAAGLTAVVAEIVVTHGWRVACFITAAAGVLQILFGLSRVARAALAISPAVVHGMLAGIGLTIVIGQLHVVLGGTAGSAAWDNLVVLPGEIVSPSVPAAALLGVITIVLTVGWPRLPRPLSAVPAPLAAVAAATVISLPFDVPRVTLPGDLLGAIQLPEIPSGQWGAVALSVLTVALVASIESLLSAVAVEAMHSGPRGDLDRELLGQGAANTVSGLLGGLPVTGVIVRSSTNVRAGARSRRSAILHGLWMAGFALLLAPVVARIPLAVLAGLLVVIGIRLVDLAHIRAIAKHGELAIYLTTVVGVVLLNLLEGVLLGVATALLLALRRTLVAPVHVHPPSGPGSPWRVVVEGALTFLSLPRLSRRLAEVPPGAPVRLDLAVDYLDHGAHKMLDDWIAERHRAGTAVTVDPVGTVPLALPGAPTHPRQRRILASLLGARPGGGQGGAVRPPRWLAPWSSWQHGHHHDHSHLLNGVDEFHRRTAPMIEPYLTELSAGQRPSTLFITCSDSRLVPNIITSSGPGDLFTVRTPGAFVPGPQAVGDSTLAAIEYGVEVLGVRTIAVCGHSGCGAINALFDRDGHAPAPGTAPLRHLEGWLRHGEPALERAERVAGGLPTDADELSRISVAQQLVALRGLSVVRRAEREGRLQLVGMWFDIATARAIVLDETTNRFEVPTVSLVPALESGQRLGDAVGH